MSEFNADIMQEFFAAKVAGAEIEVISALLDSREGRIFCALLIEESGFLKNAFSNDPLAMACAEGERSIGGRVFNLLWQASEVAPMRCMAEYKKWREEVRDAAAAEFRSLED